ncbi:uncharacterized protein LOC126988750 [Eriocheir sinensis]|uniref:uncharacterized protein LOC126988750 n=1 Tax=Eriocheir sinensis TaxID=95602 RepID=UPI0021C5CAF6|nr:uncharacterized protein LOC126988750 [Eriocheir sinensis]
MAAVKEDSKAESLNYYRFSRLVMVVPARYMARAFIWLHDGDSQSLDEFFTAHPGVFKNLDRLEKQKILEGTIPAKMDITLLYKLLFHAGNIPSANPPWHSPVKPGQQPSLGQVLYQLKGVRNENAHKNPEEQTKVTDDDLDTLAMTQKRLLTQMLTLAGQLAGKSQDTIAEAVTSMEADVATERHVQEGITVEKFVSLARHELSQRKHGQERPHYVEPRLVVTTRDALIGSFVRLRDLFSHTFQDGSRPQVIHVTGEAGAGKTSLCQAVFSSWLTEGQGAQAIADYQLVLSIACARVTSSDLHRYLRTWTLPETTQWCEDTASLTRLLREAKVLWLVDAWDEATREARGLLHEILHSKTESHTVLVTCRPELSASLTDLFWGKVLNVSFVGFDDFERAKLITGMNLDGISKESLDVFLRWLQVITSKEKELTNPLKLRLLAELWCGGQCSMGEARLPSVLQMYLYRTL